MAKFSTSSKSDVVFHIGIIFASFLVLFLTFFFVYLPWSTNHGQAITVPDLKDMSIDQMNECLTVEYPHIVELIRETCRAGAAYWNLWRDDPAIAAVQYLMCAEAARQLQSARDAARDVFAAKAKWCTGEAFSLDQLREARAKEHADETMLPDHIDYFWQNNKPVGMVAHVYSSWPDCLALAARENLRVEALPASWYYPGTCIAARYVRKHYVHAAAAVKAKTAAHSGVAAQ